MKTPALVAALVLSFAGSAFADGASYDYPQAAASQKTRAEVMAELQAARANGSAAVSEVEWPQVQFVSQRTRAEVRAEAIAAMSDPAWREMNRESGAFTTAAVPMKAPTIASAR